MYKSILEKTASFLSNKTRKGFSVDSLQKNSDKVDYERKCQTVFDEDDQECGELLRETI